MERSELASLSKALSQFRNENLPMDLRALASGAIRKVRAGKDFQEPHLVLVGQPSDDLDIGELGQTLRMQFQKCPIFAVMWDRTKFHRRTLLKNGFTDGFLLPFESLPLRRCLNDHLRKLTGGGVLSYRSIRSDDLRVNTETPFSIALYLPMNDKYVPFHNAGDVLTADRLQKMFEHKMSAALVNTDELPAFYEYAGRMSLTERRHTLEDRFRVIMSDFIRGGEIPLISEAQKFMEECKAAITDCILAFAKSKAVDQIRATMGDIDDDYNHALNTATYAAIFSLILEVGDPKKMAIAGLLHDLGEIDLPFEMMSKGKETLAGEELELYKNHPAKTIMLLQELNLPIDDVTVRAIAAHQEEFDGGGYPENASRELISSEAQVLALADRFDYLSRRKAGEPAMTVEESLDKIRRALLMVQKRPINPEYVEKILALFVAS
jgi:HD-GYP domain-containing protein (c-di-GMP phosphodiesterase class II)